MVGEKPVIVVKDSDGNTISYTDEEKVEPAIKAPTSREKVLEQLGKTGDTPYLLEVREAIMDDNCYMPVKQINRMRREVLELLSKKRAVIHDRPAIQVNNISQVENIILEKRTIEYASVEYIAGVRNHAAAVSALNSGADTVYLLSDVYEGDIAADAVKLADLCSSNGKSLFYVLPNIVRDREFKRLQSRLETIMEKARLSEFGLVISAAGQFELGRLLGVDRLRINYNFNIFNSVSANHLINEGAEAIGLSPELTLAQIRDISSKCKAPIEAVVYGYMPVMTTEYCPVSIHGSDCNQSGGCSNTNYGIIDEKRKVFRIVKLDSCRTQILNSDVLFLADELDEITGSGVSKLRGDFYIESPEEIGSIIKLYKNHRNMDQNDRSLVEKIKGKGFTKGHFYRGVD
jgi:putative protease